MSSIDREETIKGKRLMKSRGVTNLRAQGGGGAPTLSCTKAPRRQDRLANHSGKCHAGSRNNRRDRQREDKKGLNRIS